MILLGLLYLASRFLGKMCGIVIGSTLIEALKNICNYLGFRLFLQARVFIGLALFVRTSQIAKHTTPDVQELFILIVNIILLSVFINELIGPAISKYVINKGCNRY